MKSYLWINQYQIPGTVQVLLSLSKRLFYRISVIYAGISTTQHANGSICNIQKYLPNQFTRIQMLFLGNARESSIPVFVPPKYPPSRMDYPLLANIRDNTAPSGSHVNSKQKSSHSKEPLIMQFFSKGRIPLSGTVSVTSLRILAQLEKRLFGERLSLLETAKCY